MTQRTTSNLAGASRSAAAFRRFVAEPMCQFFHLFRV